MGRVDPVKFVWAISTASRVLDGDVVEGTVAVGRAV